MHFLKITSEIIAAVLGLIFISITIAWSKKDDKYYRIIEIDEWKEINILNMKLRKKKAILEKELIKAVLYEEEIGDQEEVIEKEITNEGE